MTADEARAAAKAKNERNYHLEFCLARIKERAEGGYSSAVLNSTINKAAQAKLKEMGYDVREDEHNDLYINW